MSTNVKKKSLPVVMNIFKKFLGHLFTKGAVL